MLFRASIIVAALFATSALADTCHPGSERKRDGGCTTCAPGYISTITSPAGSGAYSCTPCPAGQTSNDAHTSCVKCDPGTYNGVTGGTCHDCPTGTFNNVQGAQSCCKCCAGWFSDVARTFCNQCPHDTPWSEVGSNSLNDCKNAKGGRPDYVSTCVMVASNVCPNPGDNSPAGTAITRKKRDLRCAQGLAACPRYHGRGGFDCVDTENDPESCGGCLSLDGEGSGTDCTAIEGVSVTRCVKRSCVIDSCRKGWTKSLDGTSCVLSSRRNASSRSDLHVQGPNTRKTRSSAKRSIRANIY